MYVILLCRTFHFSLVNNIVVKIQNWDENQSNFFREKWWWWWSVLTKSWFSKMSPLICPPILAISNITVAHLNTICMHGCWLVHFVTVHSWILLNNILDMSGSYSYSRKLIRAKEQKYPTQKKTKNLPGRLLYLSVLDCCYKILVGKALNFFVHQDSYQLKKTFKNNVQTDMTKVALISNLVRTDSVFKINHRPLHPKAIIIILSKCDAYFNSVKFSVSAKCFWCFASAMCISHNPMSTSEPFWKHWLNDWPEGVFLQSPKTFAGVKSQLSHSNLQCADLLTCF